MNNNTVYVVTGLELGWDCVVGVYDAKLVSVSALKDETQRSVRVNRFSQ